MFFLLLVLLYVLVFLLLQKQQLLFWIMARLIVIPGLSLLLLESGWKAANSSGILAVAGVKFARLDGAGGVGGGDFLATTGSATAALEFLLLVVFLRIVRHSS